MGDAKSSGGWLVWVAQGFGSGRMPVAPGTWGTLPGIAVTAGLLMSGHLLWYFLGAVLLVVVAVPLCGYAERAMG
ncbi:MAG: phosphatidylglycerophosphatase A, partial [Limisphaerales bacterium]